METRRLGTAAVEKADWGNASKCGLRQKARTPFNLAANLPSLFLFPSLPQFPAIFSSGSVEVYGAERGIEPSNDESEDGDEDGGGDARGYQRVLHLNQHTFRFSHKREDRSLTASSVQSSRHSSRISKLQEGPGMLGSETKEGLPYR